MTASASTATAAIAAASATPGMSAVENVISPPPSRELDVAGAAAAALGISTGGTGYFSTKAFSTTYDPGAELEPSSKPVSRSRIVIWASMSGLPHNMTRS